MRWRQFFTPVESLDNTAARNLLANPEQDVQILDVRQPSEYSREHLPGAILIPLPQLLDNLDQLDQARPVLVY